VVRLPRAPNEKVNEAYSLYRQGVPLVEIAKRLEMPAGTVRRWKSVYKWDGERSNKSERSQKSERSESEQSAIAELVNSNLTDKQKLFCVYYVKSFNATKAYQKAYGCSYETALTNGPSLLGNARIRDEIARLKQAKLNKAMLEPEDIFQKYMDIAFADITDYVEFGKKTVPVMGPFGPIVVENEETGEKKELTKEVNVVHFKESSEVDGTLISEIKQGRDGASIKLLDRMKALQWLAEHMDMATEEQKARIEALKAKAQLYDDGDTEDDGFIEALAGKVEDVWQDE